MSAFYNEKGEIQQVEPQVEWYRIAADAGLSFEQYVNQSYGTDELKYGNAYDQILASEGIVIRPNKKLGIRATKMADILDGRPTVQAGGVVVKDSAFSSAALRTLFPSAILTAIEDRLIADLNMNANVFDSLVAITDTIQGDKYERPQLNYSSVNQRSRAVAQLAEPANMLTITTASFSRAIPTTSIGLTISDQAKQATTLDLVALSVARQVALERNARADEFFLQFLNGDADLGSGPGFASLSSLGYTTTAVALDSTSGTGITQKAWMKFLYRNSKKRVIDWVVTDINGAIAIENRSGKPTNVTDNPNSTRIDSVLQVGNPTWKSEVKVFITDDPNWPANTIMGLDRRFAIHQVISSTSSYQAIEQFVLKRASSIRMDFGSVAMRLYDEAFDVLTYT